MFTQHPVTLAHRKPCPRWGKGVSPSISIKVWVAHLDVDQLLDAPGGQVIFTLQDLITLHGNLVVSLLIKVQVLQQHR